MTADPDRELLRELAEAPGPPGAEDAVRDIVRDALDGVGEIAYDRLGSLVCERRGESERPRVVLDSHLDEVGFMVQDVDEQGYLAVVPLGGWWGHVLPGQRVDVLSERGTVPGVFAAKPPHLLSPAERDRVADVADLRIDLGARDDAEVDRLGVRIGDPVVPASEFRALAAEDVWSCKAFDDRVGVAAMCEVLRGLVGKSHPNTVVGAACVQEEVGVRGAETVGHLTRADVAIVLEATPADDFPGAVRPQGAMGSGPQVRLFDPTAIASRRLVRHVERVAADRSIPVQRAVRRGGGTDAKRVHLHGTGVPTVVVGVPARYIHTHVSLIRWDDYTRTVALVAALVESLDAGVVESLTRFE